MEDGVIRVGTAVDCDLVEAHSHLADSVSARVHNAMGCYFIQLFKSMHKLNVTYTIFDAELETRRMISLLKNGSIDIFARPVALRPAVVDNAYPIHALFMWRVGFILRREHQHRMLRKFYSKPFSCIVWLCLYTMTLLTPLLFYMLSRWERQLGNNGECSFAFELLLAIGGFCQHGFPVETTTSSRRTAYFTFFLFNYVVYTFYTSNLLSHLVNDKEDTITLQELGNNGYSFMFLEGIKEYTSKIFHSNATRVLKNIQHVPIVNISTGLEAVRQNKTALLADYSIVYHQLTRTFSTMEICDLLEIDLFSRVRKYLITSKTFRYKEQMKISTLRMQEAGILQRLTMSTSILPMECSLAAMDVTTSIEQISSLLLLLMSCYVATVLILLCERLHYKRNRLFPYVN